MNAGKPVAMYGWSYPSGALLIARDGDFHRIPGLAVAQDLPRR